MSFTPYSKYQDSGNEWLGPIPSTWAAAPIKAVASCNDETLEEDTEPSLVIDYVEIGDVNPISGISRSTTMTFAAAPSRARRRVRDGDVIVSTVRTYLRAIAAIKSPPAEMVVSTGFAVLRPRNIHPGFLAYAVCSDFLVEQIISQSVGVSYPAINASDIHALKIPVPSLAEQHAIANFLDRETAKIDGLIAEQERLVGLLEEKRQAVISHVVIQGLDPSALRKRSDVSWLGDIPQHWQIGTLTRVATRVVVGIAEAAVHAYAEEGVTILRSTNIRPGAIVGELLRVSIEFSQERQSKILRSGDLVTVRTGHAGVTAIIPRELDGCQCFTMLITSLDAGACPQYFCEFLNSKPCQQYFLNEAWGSAQPNISVPILKATPVTIPPLDEQITIAAHVVRKRAELDKLETETREAICLLMERRAALISAAVTGKIDVRGVVVDTAPIQEAAA